MSEVIRKFHGFGNFQEKLLCVSTLSSPDDAQCESFGCFGDRFHALSRLEDEKSSPGRLERLKMSGEGEL
jgi:hypothetical protein